MIRANRTIRGSLRTAAFMLGIGRVHRATILSEVT
jgi:hypothetical protein